MKPDTEIDFSEAIRDKSLDDLRFESTKDKWIRESQKDFKYLNINFKTMPLIEPPKNSSTETKQELIYIKNFIESDQEELDAESLKAMDHDPARFVYRSLEDDGYHSKRPDPVYKKDMIWDVMEDANILVMKIKLHFKRARPYQLAYYHNINFKHNKSVARGSAASPSYPSGHTIAAYFAAYISCDMQPYRSEEFLKRAKMVADSRIKEGVHFPSDNAYSIFLAEKILMPAFRERYKNGNV